MLATLLTAWALAPTPSPTISPLPPAVVQWYAQKGAAASGLDPQFVRAVIDAESGGDPHAVSRARAIGLMQLESDAASDCGITDPYDAIQNVTCGAKTLAYLVGRFGVSTGIAAYNFGGGNVAGAGEHFSKYPDETRTFVKFVIARYDDLQHLSIDATPPAAPRPVANKPFSRARAPDMLSANLLAPWQMPAAALDVPYWLSSSGFAKPNFSQSAATSRRSFSRVG